MNRHNLYRITIITGLFLVRTLQGWGSAHKPLPRLFIPPLQMIADTVPQAKPTEPKTGQPATEGPIEGTVKPLIKSVPKAKNQVKPKALPGKLPVKTPTIVKPKIIIRRIGL
ncbi:MAG: hypothetical protein EOO09_08355 [Chitinophagaceae bacterium]|nr:MAG: hypothetical protein EOO09_08355 [Chitinophagaceae bacterium]